LLLKLRYESYGKFVRSLGVGDGRQ
jgi:hypothetical protein